MPQDREALLRQVLTVAQMRDAEEVLMAAGTGVDALMQRAGHGAGEWVRRLAGGRPVTVLCGPGNNGGDGWVIAQHLIEHGDPVVVVAAREPATAAARNARALYSGPLAEAGALPSGEVLVDCLFGSGLTRPLAPELLGLLRDLAERHHRLVAVDLPSGVDADNGVPLNPDLPASSLTVVLGAWKFAHFAMPASVLCGELRLVDIGVDAMPGAARVLARPRIAAPAADAHKYMRGMLGIVGGAMPGAALLAADAAMAAGAGYVKLFAPERPAAVPHDLVCVTTPLAEALDDRRIAALLVGPGLGRDAAARERLAAVLRRTCPAVLDADALVLLEPALLEGRSDGLVLTPHEGEMARLEASFGLAGEGTKRERAGALARAASAVVVLKGPDTVIASPDGDLVLAPRAPSWLSVAGSGDVLAGLTASRLAVTRDPLRGAGEAVWLHGEAARQAGPAFTASGLARAVPQAFAAALA